MQQQRPSTAKSNKITFWKKDCYLKQQQLKYSTNGKLQK